MKTTRRIAAFMIVFCSFALQAQHQTKSAQQDSSALNQQQGTQTVAGSESASSNGDTTKTSDASTSKAAQASEAASNVPAIPQTTSSQSGSPAVLADEDGNGRDGTNNVQRATMNMAGAPAAGLNLDDRSEDADAEMKDRQHYSRDKRASAKRSGDTSESSEEINGNNRRENNRQSDQNLSSKDRKPRVGKEQEQNSESNSRARKKRG